MRCPRRVRHNRNYVMGHEVPGMHGYYTHSYPDGVRDALVKLAEPFPEVAGTVTNRWQDAGTGTEGENPLDRNSGKVIEL